MRILYHCQHLTIEHNTALGMICLTWQGKVTGATIQDAGYIILNEIKDLGATKILNDSSAVEGDWKEIAEWVTREWFPQVFRLGINFFAWLLPLERKARTSANDALPVSRHVKTFPTKHDAETWLVKSSINAWFEHRVMQSFMIYNASSPEMQILLNYHILIAVNLARKLTEDHASATS